MTADRPYSYRHLGGSLPVEDPTYVVREADRQLYQALSDREFCYVLNSRQMGKSSLRVRVMQQLQATGITCGVVDLSAMGTESTESAWYKGIAYRIMRNFRAVKATNSEALDWRRWWNERDFLSPVQQLDELMREALLTTVAGEIVIFIDEIDSVLSLNFPTDDFFGWIRTCYNNRADDHIYRRLTFCLLGVATPADLIADKQRTPFNVGQAIALDGFKFDQAQSALQPGLTQAAIPEAATVLREILAWTGGQPFLTQKLCQLIVNHYPSNDRPADAAVAAIVQTHILTNWESQDEPEHLRTIRDRFYAHPDRTNRLLGLYQQILAHNGLRSNDSPEQRELRLTGLTVKQQNQLQVFNPIYRHIFNDDWVNQALTDIRPYAQSFNRWMASNGQDVRQLLTGVALAAAKAWANGKSLSDQDYTYLAACQSAETAQVEAALAVEAQAKQVLAAANRTANRRIRVGAGVMGLAVALLTSSLVFSAQTVRSARNQAADAQAVAAQARLEAIDSQAIATAEKQNAAQARQAVDKAKRATQAANQTTQLARAAAQSAIADANTAQQTAQQAQQAARSARAQTTQAIAQRQQAEQQVQQARGNLETANQQIAIAETQQHELTVGTQLERAALALIRASRRPSTDSLSEAVRLGETLQPFLADGRSVSHYPAVAPIFALQTLLMQMSHYAVDAGVTDITLDETINVWFSADTRRYATLHSHDGFRGVYLQFWNDRGEPTDGPIEVEHGYGGAQIARPLSFYLISDRSPNQHRERELLATQCDSQTICVQDFNQNFGHRQLARVPGAQAAFNPETKELITLDQNNVLRRWKLFEQGRWLGRQLTEIRLSIPGDGHLTADGRYVWTHQDQQDQILVFDLAGKLIKTHLNPDPGNVPSRYLAFSPSGDILGQIDLAKLPGQGRQLWSLPVERADAFDSAKFSFLQTRDREHIALVKQRQDPQDHSINGSTLQLYDSARKLISEYQAQNKSITVLSQPQGRHIATVECDLTETLTQNCIGKVWNADGQILTSLTVLAGGLRWTPEGKYLATSDNDQLHLTDSEQLKTSTYRTGGNLQSFQPGAALSDAPLYFWIQKGPQAELWRTTARSPIATASPLGMNASVRAAWYDESSQTMFVVSDHVEHGAALLKQSLDQTGESAELISYGQTFGIGRDWVFSPQGKQIAVSKANGDLQLWSLDGRLEASFFGHEGAIDTVRFSPDGSQILTYSKTDKTVRLWDLQGRQIAQYESEVIPAINPDWSKLITIERRPRLHPQIPETQLKVWQIDRLETLLADACQRLAWVIALEPPGAQRRICH